MRERAVTGARDVSPRDGQHLASTQLLSSASFMGPLVVQHLK